IAMFFAAAYCSFLLALRVCLTNLEVNRESNMATISIIVAMKNEGTNVRSCLEALIRQNYAKDKMEIVVVDDGSTDETPQLLEAYRSQCPGLKVIRHQSSVETFGGKKSALSTGIKASEGEILLFTDADCVPPADWAAKTAAHFAPGVGLVVGFSPLYDPKDTLIGKLLLIDSLVNGIVAAGSIGLGTAATCTGRNLAYRRQVYDQVNGFNDIMTSISGDDDLFLHLVLQKTNWQIRFAREKSTIVPSYQSKNIVGLFHQKKRHLSAGKYYPLKLKLAYFVFHLSNLSLFLFFLIATLTSEQIFFATFLLGIKFLGDGLLIYSGGKAFGIRPKFESFLLWELFFMLYHVIIAPFAWFGRVRWK
ncbi:MAG: glycosyltransferase, partial [candidate division KSB1 bacterium]|nr:glycosyltransferase [candidate division KSB1 bacterium]